MNITQRIRDCEKSKNPQKLAKFLLDAQVQQIDLRPYQKRITALQKQLHSPEIIAQRSQLQSLIHKYGEIQYQLGFEAAQNNFTQRKNIPNPQQELNKITNDLINFIRDMK